MFTINNIKRVLVLIICMCVVMYGMLLYLTIKNKPLKKPFCYTIEFVNTTPNTISDLKLKLFTGNGSIHEVDWSCDIPTIAPFERILKIIELDSVTTYPVELISTCVYNGKEYGINGEVHTWVKPYNIDTVQRDCVFIHDNDLNENGSLIGSLIRCRKYKLIE